MDVCVALLTQAVKVAVDARICPTVWAHVFRVMETNGILLRRNVELRLQRVLEGRIRVVGRLVVVKAGVKVRPVDMTPVVAVEETALEETGPGRVVVELAAVTTGNPIRLTLKDVLFQMKFARVVFHVMEMRQTFVADVTVSPAAAALRKHHIVYQSSGVTELLELEIAE